MSVFCSTGFPSSSRSRKISENNGEWFFPKISRHPRVPPVNSKNSEESSAMPPTREQFIEQAMADFESPLIGYAATLLNDTDRARDVVQDTFVRLCQQDAAKVRDSLKSWLFTVCRNRALDVLRKEKRTRPLDDSGWKKVAEPSLQPDEQADFDERLSRVMALLDRLTENQREVILLKFQHGLSYHEIEAITGLGNGNIGFLIHTGLKRLRDLLPDDLR
jgi:RNA polymerase sigma factor (sigma-70 family)